MCVSCQRNSIDLSFQIGYVSEKGGGKGCAYLLSVQTSRYSMCFSSIFYESHPKLSERTPFRPPFFKWSHGKNMKRGASQEWKIILITHLVRILQHLAWNWKTWQKIGIFCHDRSSKSAMISWNQLIFICGYEFHARKVYNTSIDKPFEPRERYMCLFLEIIVSWKGVQKGVRPLLYESWWLNAKFGQKIDIISIPDDIYSIMRSNQCSGNPPPFPHPFSDHIGGRANAMVNRYPWYSGIFFILGVTTEIEGSIKTSRTPFRTPFLYQLCIYNYA